jgi:hypothetical protein
MKRKSKPRRRRRAAPPVVVVFVVCTPERCNQFSALGIRCARVWNHDAGHIWAMPERRSA